MYAVGGAEPQRTLQVFYIYLEQEVHTNQKMILKSKASFFISNFQYSKYPTRTMIPQQTSSHSNMHHARHISFYARGLEMHYASKIIPFHTHPMVRQSKLKHAPRSKSNPIEAFAIPYPPPYLPCSLHAQQSHLPPFFQPLSQLRSQLRS